MSYHSSYPVDLSKPADDGLIEELAKGVTYNMGWSVFAVMSAMDNLMWTLRCFHLEWVKSGKEKSFGGFISEGWDEFTKMLQPDEANNLKALLIAANEKIGKEKK